MKEKNRDILNKAIGQLPEFGQKDPGLWHKIENRLIKADRESDIGKFNFKLPGYQAPEDLWARVEEKLQNQHSNLTNAILDMPVFKAPENTWEMIDYELNKIRTLKQKNTIRLLIRISAAAALVLSIGYSILIWDWGKYRNQDIQQRSKTEIYKMDDKEDTGIETIYNPALCQSNPQICNTTLFKSLDKELNDIKAEIETMKPMIKGNDPQLLKYYYRLVNERAEIEKRMVKIIMQT
jgi:hypothetical protein